MRPLVMAVLALAVPLVLGGDGAWAAVQYLGDGALQNNQGGWNLPAQGTCPADLAQTTRPDCLALRFPVYTSSTLCTDALTGGANRSWSTGVCNDTVNNADQTTCEAQPDRKWSNGVCAIVMKGDDRNNVVCAQHGGTWVTAGTCAGVWIFANSSTYNPPLFTGTTSPGPGDQCLRCHNSVTEYNGPRIRDVDWYLRMGHKNMSRVIRYVCSDGTSTTEAACTTGGGIWAPDGKPWAGPGYECSNPVFTTAATCIANGGTWDRALVIYPSDDSGNTINWTTGQIDISGTPRNLTWIYGDWLSPLPRAIYRAPASSTQVCSDPRGNTSNCVSTYGGTLINNAGASYSCARCHTTGWTSDAAINAGKLPERSFPGITWDRNSNAGFGVVNLSGGVTGDANKYASWDYWGIGCARCHSSAVDNTTNGGVPPFSSPTGMSSHHSVMTAPDAGSGYCTDSRFTAQTQCESNGGTWLTACSLNPTANICTNAITTQAACVSPGVWVSTPAWCSNALYTNQTDCVNNLFVWQAGWCTRPDLTTSGTCTGGTPALTWRTNGSQASCQVAGGAWGFSFCSVPGVCNNPLYTAQPACESNFGQWAAATDVIRCEDAGGRWTGNKSIRGQIITRLCMDCHRQETGGMPYKNAGTDATAGTYDTVNPGLYLKVGPAHGTFAFVSHPHGNQFLNSAHGKFSGTFNQVATGTFNWGFTGLYTSIFLTDAEAANTGNGCTGCHEVHKSVVEEAFEPLPGQEGAFRETCTYCHAGQYNKDLTKINHLPGPGTPLEEMATEPYEACVSCHMPDGMHLYRINPDVTYSTFPAAAITATSSAQCTAAGGTWTASSASCVVNANTAPDGAFTNAVWVDVDHACGQCHGGGTSQATTTGTTVASNKQIAVASSAGFLAGERIKVAGAGALEYDDEGLGRGDFESYIVSVPDATHINLVGAPSLAVAGAAVIQNPTKNDAPYYPKSVLAPVAEGMHDGAGVSYAVTFSTAMDPVPLTVNVTASVDCGPGITCPGFLYDWTWGDGTTNLTPGPGTFHTYPTAGTKSITLTVRLVADNLAVGTVTRNVTFVNPDLPPTALGTCAWTVDTWNMNVVDSSTDDGPDADALPDVSPTLQVIVDWGDGTTKTFGAAGASLNHVYGRTGDFTVKQKVIDSKLQVSNLTCVAHATPASFTISGSVKNSAGTINLASATVQLRRNGTTTIVRTVYTLADGSFTFGSSIKPGTYDLVVAKTGYTFGVRTIAVGPSSTGNIILANPPGIVVRRVLD